MKIKLPINLLLVKEIIDLACLPNPCGQGECISQNGNYFCRCPPGFTGPRCETCDVKYLLIFFSVIC